MVRSIGKTALGPDLYAVRYQPGCFADLPWGREEFDCLVWLGDVLTDERLAEVARAVAELNNDWIDVAGHRSQELHDEIDQAAVALGRQRAVGDGCPMTAWHTEVQSIPALAQLACSHCGNNDNLLVIVVAAERVLEEAVNALRNELASCGPGGGA